MMRLSRAFGVFFFSAEAEAALARAAFTDFAADFQVPAGSVTALS